MWIFSFRGSDVYWFHAGTYTAGRKDTDILILDDSSISRKHLTLEWSPSQHSLLVTDSSKFGTKIQYSLQGKPVAEHITGAPHTIPTTATGVHITLGNHDAQFEVRWEPLKLVLNQGVALLPADVERLLQCGCVLLNAKATGDASKPVELLSLSPAELKTCVSSCDAVLSACLEPTPTAIAALCAAKPFIGPHYFESVCSRIGPKIPPIPVADGVAFPKKVHNFWGMLLPGGTPEEPVPVPPSLFLPRTDRARLMSLETFVVMNSALEQEVRQYVPLTGASVVGATLGGEHQLQSFLNRHGSHTLLYHGETPSDEEQLVMEHIPSLAYQALLGKILQCEGLDRGRRSRVEPLFEDASPNKAPNNVAEPSIWRTKSSALISAATTTAGPSDQTVDGDSEMSFDPAGFPLSMPSYPCFASVVPTRNNSTTNTQKVFRKQRLVPGGSIVALEEYEKPRLDPTRAVVSIDDDFIIPDRVVEPVGPASARFNRFDTAAHHRVQRSTKRPREGPGGYHCSQE